MPTQANVIAALPPLTWRHLDAPPYDLMHFAWEFDQAPRRFPYVDGSGHDDTGRESYELTARLFFLNGIEGRDNLFPAKWSQEWFPAINDGSPDDLTHPILGPIRARVKKVGGDLKASTRSGIIVDVTWVETLEDPTQPTKIDEQDIDLAASATAVDTWLADLGIPYPDGTHDTSLLDGIKSIKGFLFSASTSVLGKINQIVGTVNSLIDTVGSIFNPATWIVKDTLIRIANGLRSLAKKVAALSARGKSSKTLVVDTTLEAFARDVGNTLTEIMGLNITSLREPIVPRGTILRYYTNR